METRLDFPSDSPTNISPQPAQTIEAPMDAGQAVQQLRGLVCALGASLVVVSLALSAFVFKQVHDLNAAGGASEREYQQMQVSLETMDYVVNELARYSAGKPEYTAVMAKYGIQLTPNAGAAKQPFAHQQP